MNFCVIGVGGIGSRHLESLVKIDGACIFCVDPKVISRETRENIIYLEKISDLPRDIQFDLCVIATSSAPRLQILREIIGFNVKWIILEKIAFTSLNEYDEAILLSKISGIPIYVNYIFRYADSLAKILRLESKWTVIIPRAGLCCNILHFIDLYRYLYGAIPDQFEVRRIGDIFDSKRIGYSDFFGIATFSNRKTGIVGTYRCGWISGYPRFSIDNGIDLLLDKFMPRVSETTLKIYQDLAAGWTRLPTIEEDRSSYGKVQKEMANNGNWEAYNNMPIT